MIATEGLSLIIKKLRGYLKIPVEIDRMLFHHEEHEDHEGRTENIDIVSSCPSCPSWW